MDADSAKILRKFFSKKYFAKFPSKLFLKKFDYILQPARKERNCFGKIFRKIELKDEQTEIFTRPELNAIAKERGIKYYYEYPIHELRVKLGIEKPIVKFPTKRYSRAKLVFMARERGVKGFTKLSKSELAERLGIDILDS